MKFASFTLQQIVQFVPYLAYGDPVPYPQVRWYSTRPGTHPTLAHLQDGGRTATESKHFFTLRRMNPLTCMEVVKTTTPVRRGGVFPKVMPSISM